jgi:hypothetical protein
MPEHNPYGEPLPGAGHIAPSQIVERTVRVSDRGADPRATVAASLRIVSSWHECDYRLIADEVELMSPDDPECACCGYAECENQCPMRRWRGQA